MEEIASVFKKLKKSFKRNKHKTIKSNKMLLYIVRTIRKESGKTIFFLLQNNSVLSHRCGHDGGEGRAEQNV